MSTLVYCTNFATHKIIAIIYLQICKESETLDSQLAMLVDCNQSEGKGGSVR